jgi:hypothetical protein
MGTASHAQATMASYTSGFARFSRTSDTIQVLGNTQFGATYGPLQPGTGDFTYDMHIRISPGFSDSRIISEQRNTWEDKSLRISSNGDYWFSGVSEGGTGVVQGNMTLPTDAWIHLAYVKQGTAASIYVNGIRVANHTPDFQYGDPSDSWMSIGMHRDGVGYPGSGYPVRPSFIGDLDWIRVSSGALYTANFVPPTESAVAATASTQLLYKFNEAAGTSTIYDESSNAFQGNLGVAVYPGVTATAPTLMTGTVPGPGALVTMALGVMTSRRRRRGSSRLADD